MTIRKDGSWRLDFEGSSRWGWHTYNAHQVSFTSGIWVMMTQTLIPSEMINDGAAYGTEFRLPKGTWMNPDDRRVAFSYSWHFLVSDLDGPVARPVALLFRPRLSGGGERGQRQHLQLAPGRRLQPV